MSLYSVLDGKLQLCGAHYRSTEDALWLAASLPKLSPQSTVLDVGAGNGIIGLSLMARYHCPTTLIECQQELITSAETACHIGGFTEVSILQETWPCALADAPFDYVVSNPPYHLIEEGFESTCKALAHGITRDALNTWVIACNEACKTAGQTHLFLSEKSYQSIESTLKALGLMQKTALISHPERPSKSCFVILKKGYIGPVSYFTLHTHDTTVRDAVLKDGQTIKAHLLARP